MFRATAQKNANGAWFVEELQPSGDYSRRVFRPAFPMDTEPVEGLVYEWDEDYCPYDERQAMEDHNGRSVEVYGEARPAAVVWAVEMVGGRRCGVETAVGNRLP